MFKRKKKQPYKCYVETNLSELKLLLNKVKSLSSQSENKQIELKRKISEYESLVKQTENTIKEINKFKLKAKIKKATNRRHLERLGKFHFSFTFRALGFRFFRSIVYFLPQFTQWTSMYRAAFSKAFSNSFIPLIFAKSFTSFHKEIRKL